MTGIGTLLKMVTELWRQQIKLCEKRKERDFGRTAKEIMEFVGRSRADEQSIETLIDGVAAPPEKADKRLRAINMTQAFIDIMSPYVFARVPNRLVTPRRPQIPPELEEAVPDAANMQAAIKQRDTLTAFLLQWWLNYCPKVYGLTEQGKIAVADGLSKGMGVLWLELCEGPEGPIPASYADTVDNFLIDADAQQLREAGFICRRRRQSVWRVAQETGEKPDDLRGKATSARMQAADDVQGRTQGNGQPRGDVYEYYEIWSVMGLGEKLLGAPNEMQKKGAFYDLLEQVGPYVHFTIGPGIDHPLGMSPDKLSIYGAPGESDDTGPSEYAGEGEGGRARAALEPPVPEALEVLKEMLAWPIKTYANPDNPWPVNPLVFKPRPDTPWPKAILEAALPLQRIIDRIAQTLMNRVRAAGRDVGLVSQALEEKVVDAMESLKDLELVPVAEDKLKEMTENLIQWIKFPEMNKDILPILRTLQEWFRELTGMDPAVFGGIPKTQDRSAKASSMREAGLSRRPDDYADAVEAWQSAVSASEALAARLLVDANTVAPLFGEVDESTGEIPATKDGQTAYGPLTQAWMRLVSTDNPAIAAAEMSYQVEAGSGRRRNKQLLQQNAQQLYTMLSQQFYAFGETPFGSFKPYINLVRMVGESFDAPVEPLLDAFEKAIVEAEQAAQQQAQQQQGAAGGGAEPGATGPGGRPNPGGAILDRRYQVSAGAPKPMTLPSPPETGD